MRTRTNMPKVRVTRHGYSIQEVLAVVQERHDRLVRTLRTTKDEGRRADLSARIDEQEYLLDNLIDLIDEMRFVDVA